MVEIFAQASSPVGMKLLELQVNKLKTCAEACTMVSKKMFGAFEEWKDYTKHLQIAVISQRGKPAVASFMTDQCGQHPGDVNIDKLKHGEQIRDQKYKVEISQQKAKDTKSILKNKEEGLEQVANAHNKAVEVTQHASESISSLI